MFIFVRHLALGENSNTEQPVSLSLSVTLRTSRPSHLRSSRPNVQFYSFYLPSKCSDSCHCIAHQSFNGASINRSICPAKLRWNVPNNFWMVILNTQQWPFRQTSSSRSEIEISSVLSASCQITLYGYISDSQKEIGRWKRGSVNSVIQQPHVVKSKTCWRHWPGDGQVIRYVLTVTINVIYIFFFWGSLFSLMMSFTTLTN